MRRWILIGVLAVWSAGAGAEAPGDDQAVRGAIVKIYTIQNPPDYYNPWSMRGPRSGTGSGCVVAGRKILTNAHVVSDETFIQVRRYGEARRYEARVLSVSHEADLALLGVDDPAFFEGVEPLPFGTLPEAQQEVLVYGFPLGGDTLSITKGVVSRIEHQTYAHSSVRFLAGQIDAAINPGNSGGPVIVDGRIVGVVMQSISQADNIGYMVPVNIARHFLADISDGRYDGFPSLGVVLENLENPDLKEHYAIPEDQTGVLIVKVLPGSPADGLLEPGDVLTGVDGQAVADNGTVEFRPKERTSVSYLVQKHQVGDSLRAEVVRDGAAKALDIPLSRPNTKDWLVPQEAYDALPSYFIYGGVVFCPLSKNYLRAWGPNWYNTAPKELVAYLSANFPEKEDEQVILLLKVLAADVNQGYHEFSNWVVRKVNGKEVLNLRDLVRRVEAERDTPYVVFESKLGQQVVLNREKAEAALPSILRIYRIREDRSPDLRRDQPATAVAGVQEPVP